MKKLRNIWSKYLLDVLGISFCLISKFSNYSYDLALPCSLYRDDLVQQGALDVDKMVEQGFAKWFRCHVSQYTLCF